MTTAWGSWAKALVEATEKKVALQRTYNEAADTLIANGANFSIKPFEKAKDDYVKALIKLHHESELLIAGGGSPSQEAS